MTCECGSVVRKLAMESKVDTVDTEVVEVGPLGVTQRSAAHPPLVLRCPHGTTWMCQPTEWQIKDWELRRVS